MGKRAQDACEPKVNKISLNLVCIYTSLLQNIKDEINLALAHTFPKKDFTVSLLILNLLAAQMNLL